MRCLDAPRFRTETERGHKSPGMEIIPLLVVVLLCAPWLATGLELHIPGVGRMNLEFIRETTTPGAVEGRTEGPDGDKTTLAGQETQNPGNKDDVSDKTDRKTGAAEADQTTKAENEAVTEGTTKKSEEGPTTSAKGNDKTTQADNAQQSEATKVETKKAEATTEAQAKPKDKPNKEDKRKTTASTAKNSEAITEATTVKDEKAATSNPDKNSETTTEQDAIATTAKPESEEEEEQEEDDDDFDMSDVWDDVEEPPEEFGHEYDLDPKLLDSGTNSSDDDFQPKLELPPDMTKDMFYNGNSSNNETKGVTSDEGGFFDRLKKFFSIGNLIEQLDTIPGKVQSLMDQFQQKKSSGLRSLREKMDGSAESIGNKISEAFARMKPSKNEPNAQECLRSVQESFKEYEAALQGGIEPCLEKAQSLLGKQEGALKGAMGRFSRMLSDMQGCAQKLEGASIKEFVTSIFNMGSCTKNNIQSKIEQALQPQMQRLSELIQRQGKALQGNMDATGECIKRKLQLSKFQKQRLDLIAEGKRCLERRQ